MTIDEFLHQLEELGLEWRLAGSHLRCLNGDCPVVALAREWGKLADALEADPHYDANVDALHLGEQLGLSTDDAARIVYAADCADDDPLYYDPKIRKRLLRVVGVVP